MTDEETLNLIFLPGLSTASHVTNISGRGVGMDVVRTNVERIGGTVDVSSQEGAGTVLRLRIPLTLAIIPGLLVTARAGSSELPFVIPQVAVAELVRIDEGDRCLESVQQALIYRLRGRLLPVTHLNDVLGLGQPALQTGARNMIVLETEHRQFGLIVDTLHDTQEIVVKPLGHHMKGLNSYAGATILGDGRVALILDVAGLAEASGVFLSIRQAETVQTTRVAENNDTQTLLLLRAGTATQLAIPLANVSRLEEFPTTRIETTDGRPAIQYRGRILPLAPLAELLNCPAPAAALPTTRTIVLERDGLSAGLIVEEISDIVEAACSRVESSGRFGLRGSTIINNRVTDLLDPAPLLTAAIAYRRPSTQSVGALARALENAPVPSSQLQ
jgi:two-component system chemotaxis sensor kinase CheA